MQDRVWMRVVGLFLAIQFAFCASLALAVGFREPPPFAKYAQISFSLVLLVFGVRGLWSLRLRPDSPTRHLLGLDWTRQRGFALTMVLVWLQFVALTWAKAMLPVATSMWADIPLANIDAVLFGQDAWRVFPSAGGAIDALYMAWMPSIGFAFVLLYFSKRSNRAAALLAFFIIVGLLGTIGQYAFPSGGPIFFQRLGLGDRFAEIPWQLRSHTASTWLWAAFKGNYISFATGISAFPSIHVATATWIALSFRNVVAVIYAALIFVASVVLGWHYAIDGIAGALGAFFCTAFASWLLRQKWHGAMPASGAPRASSTTSVLSRLVKLR